MDCTKSDTKKDASVFFRGFLRVARAAFALADNGLASRSYLGLKCIRASLQSGIDLTDLM